MAAASQTDCLSLLTHLLLFSFLHGALCTPSDADDPLVCNRHSNLQVSFRYIIPKRFGGKPVKLSLYYKMKEETKWKLRKTYAPRVTAEIADVMEAPFQPTTLYQLQVKSEQPSLNDSDISECDFCSRTDMLDPVYNLTVHAVDSNWFAMTWRMPPRICPKEVDYRIRYRSSSSVTEMEFEEPRNILTLNTGEKYVRIENNVLPNNTYNVSIELRVNEFKKIITSPSETTILKTLPNPKPPTLKKPYVTHATKSTLQLKLHTEERCAGLCVAKWEYKEPDETIWHFAGRKNLPEEMEITGLNASTVYEVRAFLDRHSEYDPQESENLPFVWASTLPVRDPINPEQPPKVVKSSNTSLTVITGCQSCAKGFIAHWEYKNESHFDTWKLAGKEQANREMTIKGLEPDKTYDVRFSLHWPTSNNLSKYSPSEKMMTCPNSIPSVRYLWARKRQINSLMMTWSVNVSCRVQFFLRWKPYDFTDDTIEYPSDSYDSNKCPYSATLVNCANTDNCEESITEIYSFSVTENITPATRYFFEVSAVDWNGKCSASEVYETATPISYWGGITVGLWVLIILGMLMLFAALPACFFLKKRVAARLAAGRDVSFNAFSNGTDPNGEDVGDADSVVFHEPTTRILDRRSEPPDT